LAGEGRAHGVGVVREATQVLVEVQRFTRPLAIVELDLQECLEEFAVLRGRAVGGDEGFDAWVQAGLHRLVEAGARVGNAAPGLRGEGQAVEGKRVTHGGEGPRRWLGDRHGLTISA
jgi:hypothetical protein